MDQIDTLLEELSRQGRIAYRRLVRAGAPQANLDVADGEDLVTQIAHIKKQLRVEVRLQRTSRWAFRTLRTAALESHLACLLQAQSLRAQQTTASPASTT